MSVRDELWIAYAGDKLTCAVSIDKIGPDSLLCIKINGWMDEKSVFVTGVILAMMANFRCSCSEINLKNMSFREGRKINDYAIDCALNLISAIMCEKIRSTLIIDDDFMRDILETTLCNQPGFKKVTICSDATHADGPQD